MQIVIIVVDTVISIHALLAESDFMFSVVFYLENIFLSTLSLRRATTCGGGWNEQPRYFYPRSPCGERHAIIILVLKSVFISIHALLAESDRMFASLFCGVFLFLSTLSLRRATQSRKRHHPQMSFLSTLSLRRATEAEFFSIGQPVVFLSTLSLRRAT